MTGSDDHQTKLATIATNVKGGVTNSVKYVTKDSKGTAWATRFTITDDKGNHGTLHPSIPPGGKINPGGVGAIIPAPKKKGAPKAGAPAKAPPANAHSASAPVNAPKAPALKQVPEPIAGKQTQKSADLDHVDASSSDKVVSAGVPNAAPWFSTVMGAVATFMIALSML
ncbi:hypothetical protein BGZ93_003406 [Podila epicladia]|nr:hypothetical protein BGZ93_003406 [Podila epicladia]